MSAVTFTETGDAAGVPFTVADLERTPDDGRRYELLDGTLVVNPRPAIAHQRVGFRLAYALEAACPDGLIVVPEPAVQISRRTELAPDIVVARADQSHGMKFTPLRCRGEDHADHHARAAVPGDDSAGQLDERATPLAKLAGFRATSASGPAGWPQG
jgi:putative restriction endonuclease